MTPEQLKASILQLAIQGKLVPQRPEDGSAEDLYQQIQREKKKLTAAGKLKKEKPLPPITEEEIPFDIPDSWKWVRFGSIVINRDSERIPLSVAQREKLHKVYDYYGASGVIDKVDDYLFDKPLLLIGEDGANLLLRSKPIAFIASGKYWVNNHAHVLDVGGEMVMEYLELYINAISLAPYITGTAQPKMNQEKMNSIPVALPSHGEQIRIVQKVKELLPLVEQYGEAYTALESLDARFPDDMRKSILQYAIQGKLVPQRPEEGTAEELYQQIQKEKKKLTAAGKLKKEKPLPPITEEEIPFDIPDSWKWVRLGAAMALKSGQDLQPTQYNAKQEGIPYITGASNITDEGKIILNRWTETPKTIAVQGDILLSCKGTIGKMAVLNEEQVHIARQIMAIRCIGVLPEHLMLFVETQITQLKEKAKSFIPGIERDTLRNLVMPLPPLAEQRRIVEKIEQTLPQIGQTSTTICASCAST